jgi:hypothetical protein
MLMSSVCIAMLVLAGVLYVYIAMLVLAGREGKRGWGLGQEGLLKMGQLTLGKRPARSGFAIMYKKPPFQVRGLFLLK